MSGLELYIHEVTQTLAANHPRGWTMYERDPVECWRYIMRNFGHGLADFPEKEALKELGTLYGKWFIALDFTLSRPNINAKEFVGWAIEAMNEERERKNLRDEVEA